jgi:hypothetical protein
VTQRASESDVNTSLAVSLQPRTLQQRLNEHYMGRPSVSFTAVFSKILLVCLANEFICFKFVEKTFICLENLEN